MPARLIAFNEDSERAMGVSEVTIETYPFKVGREARSPLGRVVIAVERRMSAKPQLNDLYLMESPLASFLHVSREHFLIDLVDGQHVLVDRGSKGGTLVNGTLVGRERAGGQTPLADGDLITVGTTSSPFVYQFRIS